MYCVPLWEGLLSSTQVVWEGVPCVNYLLVGVMWGFIFTFLTKHLLRKRRVIPMFQLFRGMVLSM